jgi:dihydrofolate reductase
MTRVHAYVEGDIYFPMIDEKYWSLDSNKDISADEKNKFDMSFQIWTKK